MGGRKNEHADDLLYLICYYYACKFEQFGQNHFPNRSGTIIFIDKNRMELDKLESSWLLK